MAAADLDGVSVESTKYTWRIDYLRKAPAAIRFISAEPLLGCVRANVAFFLKQLGGHPSKRGGDRAVGGGRRWIELPLEVQRGSINALRNGSEQLST